MDITLTVREDEDGGGGNLLPPFADLGALAGRCYVAVGAMVLVSTIAEVRHELAGADMSRCRFDTASHVAVRGCPSGLVP